MTLLPTSLTPPDVVETWPEGMSGACAPLLVGDPLARWCRAHGLGGEPLEVARLGDGHSNVTFLVVTSTRRMVLRRPPRPPLPPSAHDVLREAWLLRQVAEQGVPVPEVLATCEDAAVIGAPFYMMPYLDGFVPCATLPRSLDTPAQRRAIAVALVEGLAAVHAVDVRRGELASLRRSTAYVSRQLKRFASLWATNRTREIPRMDGLTEWLAAHRPARGEETLVHGDYRLGNTLFDEGSPARLGAILDWELATVGDPLADLGYLVATYADGYAPSNVIADMTPLTRTRGFPSRAELVAHYGSLTGRTAPDLRWYVVFALWRSAIFLEGNYRRFLSGGADDPFFAQLKTGVPQMVADAARIARDARWSQ